MINTSGRWVEATMQEKGIRQSFREAFVAKIHSTAMRAQRGEWVMDELESLVDHACSQVVSLNRGDPELAVRDLIASTKAKSNDIPESDYKAKAVFALAVLLVEARLGRLGN